MEAIESVDFAELPLETPRGQQVSLDGRPVMTQRPTTRLAIEDSR